MHKVCDQFCYKWAWRDREDLIIIFYISFSFNNTIWYCTWSTQLIMICTRTMYKLLSSPKLTTMLRIYHVCFQRQWKWWLNPCTDELPKTISEILVQPLSASVTYSKPFPDVSKIEVFAGQNFRRWQERINSTLDLSFCLCYLKATIFINTKTSPDMDLWKLRYAVTLYVYLI